LPRNCYYGAFLLVDEICCEMGEYVNVIKVCFYTTNFQADVIGLASYLEGRDSFDVLVVVDNLQLYKKEKFYKLGKFSGKMLDKEDSSLYDKINDFSPDITVVDNHFPKRKISKYLFVLWHGFGWKGPNDIKEFKQVHKSIKKLTGYSGFKSNPYFLWQCFGITDMEHRNKVSGFHSDNLVKIGSVMSDDIVKPFLQNDELLTFYPDNFFDRKVALLAFTWHYGKVFSHWGDELEILEKIIKYLDCNGYSTILRLHDKKRYDASYLSLLEEVASNNSSVLLKFNGENHDNLIDILSADLMMSNFSSILNYFYFTGKPSIHIYPVKEGTDQYLYRIYKRGKVRLKKGESAEYIWKMPPEENGGLLAKNLDELLNSIEISVNNPEICREKSFAFINKHMVVADGKRAKAVADAIIEMVAR